MAINVNCIGIGCALATCKRKHPRLPSLSLSLSMSESTQAPHIFVFPFPAQGHMLPMLDLTHQLALRGLTLTILVTPKNLPTINPLLSTHPSSIHTLLLPFPDQPSLPAGVENVSDVGNSTNLPIIAALGRLHDQIIRWFKSHPTPPVAILSDFFLGFTQHLAHQLGIPRIAFYSTGCFFRCVIDFLWQNITTVRSSPAVHLLDLPGSPSFVEQHFPSSIRQYRVSDPDGEFLKDGMLANMSSWGCIFNSFEALEAKYFDHLKKKMGHGRVWAVGPLHLADTTVRVNPDKVWGDDVLEWLDGCPEESVLYVCFGSQKVLTRDQMDALAAGLEQSGIRFVWVVKSGTAEQTADGYGFVPEGFEDRVSGRGMVIRGWAPQVSILSHRAVSGFLSHCGWNSLLEGLAAGVMILAWPMEADQFVEARLLVEDMGAAVRVCEGTNTVPDPDELGRVIAESMNGGQDQKVRTKEMRDWAAEAVKEGGSSCRDMEGVVRELGQLQVKIV